MVSFCTQTACKDTAFFRIVQVFYAICPIFLLSYRDDIGEERLPCARSGRKWVIRYARRMCAYMRTRCMQYAVFVYVSSAKAVIQDLFLFLFKTKDRERSEIIDRAKRRRTIQAARETSTLLWGKENQK